MSQSAHIGPKDDWGFPQEREFMENLVCQRFNFLLVFFSLVVGGAITCEEQTHLIIVLWLGAIITILVSLTIFGSHLKLIRILDVLIGKNLDELSGKNHAITVIDGAFHGWSLKGIIGWAIPGICSAALLLGAILASFGILKVKGKANQTPEPTPTAVTSPAAQEPRRP